MTIPVETLCLWEEHYKHGDYAKLSLLTGIKPKALVNHLHNTDMPEEALNIFIQYYQAKESPIGI